MCFRHALRCSALLLATLTVHACARSEGNGQPEQTDRARASAPVHPATTSEPAPAQLLPLGDIASEDAFELVATSDGAAVVWVAPGPCDASLRVQRFDAEGRRLGGAVRAGVVPCGRERSEGAQITELAATAAAGKLAAAWIVEDATSAVVFGSVGSDAADALAPAQRIAEASRERLAARGRLMLSASPIGQMRMAFRAPDAACVGAPGRCAKLVTQAFPVGAERPADAREMPTPCARMLVGAHALGDTWYDAFCAVTPRATEQAALTLVYAIRPEISYAEAVPVLEGCEPLGVAPTPRGVAVLGTCEGQLRAHVVAGQGRALVLDGVMREAKCVASRPLLALAAADGARLEVPLDEPRDRLELLLAPGLASARARAAFTGSRLLVADVQRNRVVLRTFVCRGDALVAAPALL